MIAGMITNGYLLTADRIKRLNRAGLDHLQISIDNVMPDDVSKKSLKVLDKKLQLLAEHAEFHVNINSVVGGGIRNPHDALVVGRRAVQLGLHLDHRHHSRRRRPAAAAGRRRARSVHQDEEAGEEALRALQLVPGQHRRTASPTTGDAAPARATCISARTGWCITARSSAAIPAFRWRSTRWTIFAASFSPKKAARRTAPSRACTRCRTWISGALRKPAASGTSADWTGTIGADRVGATSHARRLRGQRHCCVRVEQHMQCDVSDRRHLDAIMMLPF